jgi:cytoskeletal protein RodZ
LIRPNFQELMVKKHKEPNVWITALKLVLLVAVIIGAVGLALWYAAHLQRFDDSSKTPVTPASSWGIVNDSPLRR